MPQRQDDGGRADTSSFSKKDRRERKNLSLKLSQCWQREVPYSVAHEMPFSTRHSKALYALTLSIATGQRTSALAVAENAEYSKG